MAIQGDIQAMFHQVRVPVRDRDVLRYLWWKDGILNGPVKVYRMKLHLLGGTWSPACSFALRYVAENQQSSYGHLTTETVKQGFYVDNCLKAVADGHEGIRLIQELRSMLAEGGFRLTKLASNSRKVLESIPVDERAKSVTHLDLVSDNLPYEKALGIIWNLQDDILIFKVVVKDKPLTRRGMLSSVSSLFDPLGLVTPFTVRGRMLMQELVRLKIGWNDDIPEHLMENWNDWLCELPALDEFKVDRCIVPKWVKGISIASFCLCLWSSSLSQLLMKTKRLIVSWSCHDQNLHK